MISNLRGRRAGFNRIKSPSVSENIQEGATVGNMSEAMTDQTEVERLEERASALRKVSA